MSSKQSNKLISKDYVFNVDDAGRMKFVGDFEGLYSSEDDPWGQSGLDARLGEYYAYSRNNLIKKILLLPVPDAAEILEVGCGLGQVTDMLREANANLNVTGMDISSVAIEKARARFPHIEFLVGDIAAEKLDLEKKFDVIILNQALWYVLGGLPQLFNNVERLLKPEGFFIIVNAFLHDQSFGKEIIDGFDGLVKYAAANLLGARFKLVDAQLDVINEFIHQDGILIIRLPSEIQASS